MSVKSAGKIERISTWIAILALLSMIPLTLKPSITGLTIAPVHEQTLHIPIEKTQHFRLSHVRGARISTFAVTGTIRGKGIVDILLKDHTGKTLRAYRNTHEPTRGLLSVTGAFAAIKRQRSENESAAFLNIMPIKTTEEEPLESLPEGGAPDQGRFFAACEETCSIPDDFGGSDYELVARVGPNTSMTLDTISYSVD